LNPEFTLNEIAMILGVKNPESIRHQLNKPITKELHNGRPSIIIPEARAFMKKNIFKINIKLISR
jgi:hypothetical protein